MAKESTEQFNEDEIKILIALHHNAKAPINTIAKRTNLSVQKVRRIIKKLEKRRIIWGYTAVTDTQGMNLTLFMSFIKKADKPIDNRIMEKIDSMDLEDIAHPLGLHIISSYYVHGDYDWIVIYSARDLLHARKLSDVLYHEFPGYIKKIDIQQVLYSLRTQHIFNPDKKRLHDLMR
jgi:DNA-binding Lrp family transcriptional regulator